MRWPRLLQRLRSPHAHLAAGARGEQAAAKHLKKIGYRILARNLRTRLGEIDILARDPATRCLVVVEVKTSTDPRWLPEQHVDTRKQRKLASLGAMLLKQRRFARSTIRFDVVGVVWPASEKKPLRVTHHVNAFESHL